MKYTKDILEEVIKNSSSWNEVCKKLNIKERTGSQSHLKNRAIFFNIDYSHFLGKNWSKGKKFFKTDINEYLNNKKKISSHHLKLKLFKYKLKEEKCENCGINEWLNEKVVLELDHINGNHNDNNLENLKILCPNCHALKTRKQALIDK